MAPLHYAIQQTPINKDIIEALLQSGADPNLPDGEKKSPMYYGTSVCVPADLFVSLLKSEILIFVRFLLFLCVRIVAERNELDEEIIELMKGFGGKKSNLTETEARGELFGGIADANRKTEHRRKVEKVVQENKAAEAARKAESAQSAMGDAMNALVQRGEKINEMGDKANELLEGARNLTVNMDEGMTCKRVKIL